MNQQLYTFRKNLQGDVTGIYTASGTLVAKYQYSPYGEILAITDGNGNDVSGNSAHIANVNPFRYRSYYYDTEIGFYYLQSRYYDPQVGRFLNEDSILNTGGSSPNLFAYCGNNPIKYIDPCGTCPHDGKVYPYGNFKDMLQYNPNCGKCMNHGTYTLIGKDGKEYNFRDTERNFVEKLSQEQITIEIEGEMLNNYYRATNCKGDYLSFYDKVSAGGPMDYKDPYIWAQAFPDIPYPGENKEYIAYGIEISASDLGNFNYGMVGKTYGFSKDLLLWQAGAAQLRDHKGYNMVKSELFSYFMNYYGDEKDDYDMICLGFNLF